MPPATGPFQSSVSATRLRKIAIRQKELINVKLIEEQLNKIRGNSKQLLYYVSKLM